MLAFHCKERRDEIKMNIVGKRDCNSRPRISATVSLETRAPISRKIVNAMLETMH